MHTVLNTRWKNCPRCKRLLGEKRFYKDISSASGVSVYCKSCCKITGAKK